MAEIGRLKINWTGFIGAPGYTNLYFRDFTTGELSQEMADGFTAKTDTWLDAWVSHLPSTVSILIDPTIDVLEDSTGALTDFMTVSPDTSRVGTGAGTYAAPAGAVVNWSTNGIENSRRVRGRTFMVPLTSAAFQSDGTIGPTPLSALRTATAAYIDPTGVGDLGIWHRPTTPGGTDGSWYFVTAFSIPDKAAILTSRRD